MGLPRGKDYSGAEVSSVSSAVSCAVSSTSGSVATISPPSVWGCGHNALSKAQGSLKDTLRPVRDSPYTTFLDLLSRIHAYGTLTVKIYAWPNPSNYQRSRSSNWRLRPLWTTCLNAGGATERLCGNRAGRERAAMPLVSRDPGGWMSPQNRPKAQPRRPLLTARSEPVGHPTIAPTGSPSMEYGRIALIGLQ